MRAGKNGEADAVNVFLQRGIHDHLRSLPQAGVDDFHAGIAQRAGNDFGAAVMAVEPRLGHQHADFALLRHAQCSLRRSM